MHLLARYSNTGGRRRRHCTGTNEEGRPRVRESCHLELKITAVIGWCVGIPQMPTSQARGCYVEALTAAAAAAVIQAVQLTLMHLDDVFMVMCTAAVRDVRPCSPPSTLT